MPGRDRNPSPTGLIMRRGRAPGSVSLLDSGVERIITIYASHRAAEDADRAALAAMMPRRRAWRYRTPAAAISRFTSSTQFSTTIGSGFTLFPTALMNTNPLPFGVRSKFRHDGLPGW